jgi:hypothetical protein
MSYKTRSPIFCLEMIRSENYVNKIGERPLIDSFIKWELIVFSDKNMRDDEWLFCNKDEKITLEAKKQWEALKHFDDYIFILE